MAQRINFFRYIENEYGSETLNHLKAYASSNRKLGNMTSRKQFLVRCRRRGIFPSHIINSFKCVFPLLEQNSPYLRKLERSINRFRRSLLNIEIRQTYYSLNGLRKELALLKNAILDSVPEEIALDFITLQDQFLESYSKQVSTTTKKKFNNLLAMSVRSNNNPSTPSVNSKAVHNATTVAIPSEVEVVLSLGPKFALPYTSLSNVPIFHIIADLEYVLLATEDRTKRDRNRCNLVNIMKNYMHSFDSDTTDPLKTFLQNACKVMKKFINEHPDVIIVQSDKGKQTVLMYESDYNNKMLALLSDGNTYKAVKANPTHGYQKTNNALVKRLLDSKIISTAEAGRLEVKHAACPRIYGLPKAHKPNLPLRPVVPNIGAPSYMLSKYIGRVLRASIGSEYNITDSFSFCEFINGIQLPPDHVLVSFDVVSLFTCIPRELVKDAVTRKWNNIAPHTKMDDTLFKDIVQFCLECSYFSFRGKYYKQIFGTAMGNPFSPTAADLIMDMLLDEVVERLDFELPLLRKYVDDLVLAVPADRVEYVLFTFNSYDSNLQFTCEMERDRRLPYLDMVLVRQEDQTIKTEWYAKPMASGRFLDFFSYHPLHIKMNMVANFVRRVRLFSTNLSEQQVKDIIDRQLQVNHYPESLRHRLMNRMNERPPALNAEPETTATEKLYRPLLWVDKLTCRLKKSLKVDFPNVALATRNENTINKMFTKTKDPIPPNMRTNVIYKVPCGNCEKCYVGYTTQYLKARISKHQSDVNKLDELLNVDEHNTEINQLKERTALINHSIEEQHRFTLDKAEILDQHHAKPALEILEMCHISTTENTVNKRSDVDGLSSIYAGILHLVKSKRRKPKPKQNTNVREAEQGSTLSSR